MMPTSSFLSTCLQTNQESESLTQTLIDQRIAEKLVDLPFKLASHSVGSPKSSNFQPQKSLKLQKNCLDDLPLIPPPNSMTVLDQKVVLWTADGKALTRKIGF